MIAARSLRILPVLIVLTAISTTVLATFQDKTPDFTPVLANFAKKAKDATRNRNELKLKQTIDDFHRELAQYQGKEVRCEFKVISVKPHRVLLENPILQDKTRYRFLLFAGDAATLGRANAMELEAAFDQVIVAGVRQPVPVFEKLATISERSAAELKAGDVVVVQGVMQPRKNDQYGTTTIPFVNARVVEK